MTILRNTGSNFAHCRLQIATVLLYSSGLFTQAHAVPVYTNLRNLDTLNGGIHSPTYTGLLAQGRDGNLYGTLPKGGKFLAGGAFRMSPDGKVFTMVHDFDPVLEGSTPYGGLTLGLDGNFYGTNYAGGVHGKGTVFKMTPAGVVTVLHHFTVNIATPEGSNPYAPPVQGRDGNLYGTTFSSSGPNNYGVIYRLTPSNGAYKILHNFDLNRGRFSAAPLLLGQDGNFYGTTVYGGSDDQGVVFKITPSGVYSVVQNFDKAKGGHPYGPLVQDEKGDLYGTASDGGIPNGAGILFQASARELTILHAFQNCPVLRCTGGSFPYAGLARGSDGIFYGVTKFGGLRGYGLIFSIDPATDTYTKLYDFETGGLNGGWSSSTPFLHTNGKLYGLTSRGAKSIGNIYSFDTGAPAFVRALPQAGRVGSSVNLLGGFTGINGVNFNETVPTTFTAFAGNTFVVTKVPPGPSTGLITVTKPTGNIKTLDNYWVLPTLTTFAPISGAVGTTLILTGTGLSQTTTVRLGGNVSAPFTVNSDSQLTVTVPTGALTGNVAVTTRGGAVFSTVKFTVIP